MEVKLNLSPDQCTTGWGFFIKYKKMKELKEQFIGRGSVNGFSFTQRNKSEKAYLYEVNTGTSTHYEVFKRKENVRFNVIYYPGDNSFGLWAWCYRSYDKAV